MNIGMLTSGGVDSSVALCELKKNSDHHVQAFYLKIWLEDELSYLGSCPWEQDLAYVEEICKRLDVKLEVIPMQRQYHEKVVSYTVEELKAGHTPSPDLLCNQRIKYGAALDVIGDSYDKIATGHYANIEKVGDQFVLGRARDTFKDQTYFLSKLSQEQLSKTMFPLGNLLKPEVRELAKSYDLPNAHRPDSQGICFLGKIKFNEFVKYHLGEKPGDIVDFHTGKKLGEHRGYWFHTIGQRKGLGLSGGPWYVARKQVEDNTIFVSRIETEDSVASDRFIVKNLNWMATPSTDQLQVKIRHGEKLYGCKVGYLDDAAVSVVLSEKDKGIASGQFAVFYQDKYCLGSGVIELMN